jgi:hypothetical protein
LRHGFIGAPYPNDFATWAASQVRDRVLAERLAVVSPLEFSDLSELREELVSILDDHLANLSIIPRVVFGEPFDFMQSRLLEIPTGLVVRDLSGLRDGLLMLPPSGLYLHLVEARMRKGGRATSLIGWVRAGLGREDLAAMMEKIDPHMIGLERLRGEILRLCDEALVAEVPGNGDVA